MKTKLIVLYIILLFIFPAFSFAQDEVETNESDSVDIVEGVENEESMNESEDEGVENEETSSEDESDDSTGSGALTTEDKPKPKIKRKPQTETEEETPPETSSPEVAEEQETKSDETDSVDVVDTIAGSNTDPDWLTVRDLRDLRDGTISDNSTYYFIAGAGITVILAIGGFVFIRLRRKKSLSEHTDSAVAKDIAEIDSVKTTSEQQIVQQTQPSVSLTSDVQKMAFTSLAGTNSSVEKESIDLSNLNPPPSPSEQAPSSPITIPPSIIAPSSPTLSDTPNPQIKADTVE